MIDAEKLLGGLLSQGLRGGGRRGRRRGSSLAGGLTGAVGMGVLGVAMAAFDHFSEQKKSASPAGGGAGPPQPSGAQGPSVPPPPPPPNAASPAPPPPPPGGGFTAGGETAPPPSMGQEKALLLIRAMIAAANADGKIDGSERQAIFNYLEGAGLTGEEKSFIAHEMDAPPDIDQLVSAVDSQDLARQMYTVSLLAVEVDTEAEKLYLSSLKNRLGLDDATVRGLHARFEESS